MPLTLERLKVLLKEQQDQDEENATHARGVKSGPLDAASVHKLLTRPIPYSLFHCPMSQPQTTLVPWKSLPRHVQEKLEASQPQQHDGDNKDDYSRIVEVPRAYLDTQVVDVTTAANNKDNGKFGNDDDEHHHHATIATAASSSIGRPLHGNLRDKLTEYTRGMTGKTNPFRPGGIDHEDEHHHHHKGNNDGNEKEDEEDPFRSRQAILQNQRVLDIGAAASWKEGILLTIPPGVLVVDKSDTSGITWKSLGNSEMAALEDERENNDAYDEKDEYVDDQQPPPSMLNRPPQSSSTRGSSATAAAAAPALGAPMGLFSKGFLDDDSLFGSSSSSSDDDEDDDDDKEEEESDNESQQESKRSSIMATKQPQKLVTAPKDMDEDKDEDIDALLAELSLDDPIQQKLKKRQRGGDSSSVLGNPLELAQHQARQQGNTTRKMWADTSLLPIHGDFNTAIPNPAMTFPFTLDDFQQQAVARLERNESVFIAAHTSAGKTVVAEYAVALAMQRSTRCVYTSPIKALSNQKFRDFSLKFGAKNIGLITGDLQVNADDSTCLIMTTEILRSMLYRGADLVRDIEYVIFDEVHYINDSERGVVWEEVIIMLPSHVNLVFLSATTPNTLEFSDWIGRTKRKPVHVIKTNYRPVPLSYHLWAGLKLHKILEGNGGYLEKGYTEAANALLPASAKDPKKKNDPKAKAPARPASGSKNMVWQVQGSKNDWMSLVRFLDRELLTPTVVFSFSKKKCEEIANMLRSLDLNTAKERSAVQAFTLQAVARLSPVDAQLPQVIMVCEMVQRGIGVHHGGLLPILKECVEILFSRSLVKVLFATETFAMGVNMPARAVVLNGIRKNDGSQFRVLNPSETTQIAGRAGRRGLDTVGTVIITCFGEQPPPNAILKQMLTGSSTKLSSQFRLTYNMILNLLRVEEMSVEAMIKRSFSEFATQRELVAKDVPRLLSRGRRTLTKLEEQLENENSTRVGAEDIETYFEVCKQLLSVNQQVVDYIRETEVASFQDIFNVGRLVLVTAARKYGVVRAPALVLKAPQAVEASRFGSTTSQTTTTPSTVKKMICMVLMPSGYEPQEGVSCIGNDDPGEIDDFGTARHRYFAIREIDLDQIVLTTTRKRKVDVKAIFKDSSGGGRSRGHPGLDSGMFAMNSSFAGMKALGKRGDDSFGGGFGGISAASPSQAKDKAVDYLLELENEELRQDGGDGDGGGGGAPVLDLRQFLQRGSDALYFRSVCDQIDVLLSQMRSLASHKHPNLEKYYAAVERKDILRTKVDALQHALSNESLNLFPDFLQRKEVLRRLNYVDDNEAVCVKGRVACEVNTCEELIATEMVFEGLLNDLQPEEIVAVLSSLVFQEKKDECELDDDLPGSLLQCCDKLKIIATNLGQLQRDCGLEVDPNEYCENSLKFGLVHVVYEWALGVSFKDICALTDVQEGSIVRCITRLDELCREIRNCARVVGNPSLYRKCESASAAIKRDIVFASSLYVS